MIAIAVPFHVSSAQAQDVAPKTAPRDQADTMAASLVARMTPDEKFEQLLNAAPAIPHLNVPEYNWWTESLHGALGTVPTTNFPEPIGLAATFDDALVKDVAGQISVELRALHTLARKTGRMDRIGTGLNSWSPNINIFRDPRWGRGQETYGEDPYLTAHMGVAFVAGLQGPNPELPDIIATPKHFAVHSGPESTRHSANVFVSAHDLEDTYLPAFRAAIVEGRAGSIMCAYNRVDAQPACGSDLLLKDRLRGAWGFKGYVVSDCDAVKDIADTHRYAPDAATAAAVALHAGMDNECNTGTIINLPDLGARYRDALKRGLISQNDIDSALIRLFSARYRVGDLAGLRDIPKVPLTQINSSSAQALALRAAERSLVLLKNDGTLPLKPGVKLAVIGPLADATRVLRGNYSSSQSNPPVSIAQGLRAAFPQADVSLVPFGESFTDGDRVPTSALRSPSGKPGLLARYYNAAHAEPQPPGPDGVPEFVKPLAVLPDPVVSRIEPDAAARSLDLAQVSNYHKVVWTGFLVPPATGTYRLGLAGFSGKMTFEGKPFVDLGAEAFGALPNLKTVKLVAGHRYPIEITAQSLKMGGVDLMWKRVVEDADAQLDAAAAKADVIVAVVGLTSDMEGEETRAVVPGFKGGDKTTLDLPADQIAMLERAHKTGKPLVVVAMNGSPINLGWAKENAAAIVEAWYPGQSGGTAVADVLSGKVNPSGRLPLTFYRRLEDLPAFDDYSMEGRTYRYFAGKPLYPFGYGLSYTTFDYQDLHVAQQADDGSVTIKARVRNTGQRAGAEVAQLYLTFPDIKGAPRIALRGFKRFELKPGESREVAFTLSPRDLSAVSQDGQRQMFAGHYRVSVGSGQPNTGVPGSSAEFDIGKTVALPE
ncbi:glycoside hydrolase family 3 C-terminal domain-containing protein [Novosphingobium umbonatum]